MPDRVKIAMVSIATVGFVVASFFFAGRYHFTTIRTGGPSYVMMVDRFTGAAVFCIPEACRPILTKPALSGAQ